MEDICRDLTYIEKKCKSHISNRCRLFKRLKKQYGKSIIDMSTKRKRDLLIPNNLAEDFLHYYHAFAAVRPKHGDVYAFFSTTTTIKGFVYVHLKIGMTKKWETRKKSYLGPSRICEEILVFYCSDKRKVENELKPCLHGFKALTKEWFLIPISKKGYVCRLLKRVVNRTVMKSLYKEIIKS